MDNYSSNLIGLIKAAGQTQAPTSVPGSPTIPKNPLPGYNNANAARQKRQQYTQQQQASSARQGAALRAHKKALEEAAKAQEAYLNQSRAYRAEQNDPLVDDIKSQVGYQNVKFKNNRDIFTEDRTLGAAAYIPATIEAISDYKLLNKGTLPTEEQAYAMTDRAIENVHNRRVKRLDGWEFKEGEEKKLKDYMNDVIYKLYQQQPWGGRYVDEVVRNNTNPQGAPIA